MEITLPPATVAALREQHGGKIGEYIEQSIAAVGKMGCYPALLEYIKTGGWFACLECQTCYRPIRTVCCPDCGDKKVRLLDALEKTARDTEQSSKAKKAVSARKPSCKGATGRVLLLPVLKRARRSSRA
jgi:hypothetical protein